MITIYWKYKGYVGDEFSSDLEPRLRNKFAPNSRDVGFRYFGWRTQKGFGPGYFTNSGVYQAFRKSVFKTEADRDVALALMSKDFLKYTLVVFKDDVAYYDDIKEIRAIEKRMHKQNPY